METEKQSINEDSEVVSKENNKNNKEVLQNKKTFSTVRHLSINSDSGTSKEWSDEKHAQELKEEINKSYPTKLSKNTDAVANLNPQLVDKELLVPKVFEELGVSFEEFKKLEGIEEFKALSHDKRLFVAEQLEQLALENAHKNAKEEEKKDTAKAGLFKKILRNIGKENRIKKLEEKKDIKDIISSDDDLYGEALVKFIKDAANGPDVEFNNGLLRVLDSSGRKYSTSEYLKKEKRTAAKLQKYEKEVAFKEREKEIQKKAIKEEEKKQDKKLSERAQKESERIKKLQNSKDKKNGKEENKKLEEKANQENDRIEKAKSRTKAKDKEVISKNITKTENTIKLPVKDIETEKEPSVVIPSNLESVPTTKQSQRKINEIQKSWLGDKKNLPKNKDELQKTTKNIVAEDLSGDVEDIEMSGDVDTKDVSEKSPEGEVAKVKNIAGNVEEIEMSGGAETKFQHAVEKIDKKDSEKTNRILHTIGIKSEEERIKEIRNEIQESEIVTEELEKIPEGERGKIRFGLRNMGFFIEEGKNNLFAGVSKWAIGLVEDKKGTTARFLLSLSENFTRDAEQARGNIEKIEKGEKKRFSNAGYLAFNVLKYGRIITDFTGYALSSPARGVMLASTFFARGAEAAKEARLKNEEVIERTRINDIEEAADEAWRIYKEALGDKESISRDELERAYQKNVPQDLIKRLKENPESGIGSGIIQKIIKKDVELLVKRIDGKIRKIEENDNLSDNEKELRKEKILNKYSKHLKSFDRLVSQYGTVDALAMGAKYAETGAKAVVAGMVAETLTLSIEKIWGNLAEVLSNNTDIDIQTSIETHTPPLVDGHGDVTPEQSQSEMLMEQSKGISGSQAEMPDAQTASVKEVISLPHEEIAENIVGHSVIEKGGSIWDSAKSMVKNPHDFNEAWKNSMVKIPGHEGLVHISKVNLVHTGTVVEYVQRGVGESGHFEIVAPEGHTLPDIKEQTAFTERNNHSGRKGLSKRY